MRRIGRSQTYNDILPFAETMHVVIDGSEYVVLDQYCSRRGCRCTDAHLNLLPITEGSGVLEPTGVVSVDYVGRRWGRAENEPLCCDIATFRGLMEDSIPDLYAKLDARNHRLRAIYAHCRKRARAAVADDIPPQTVGRNDPCPCGTGKKFKKCCLGKRTGPHPLATPCPPSRSAAGNSKRLEPMPKHDAHRAGCPIERIVIDECLGPASPLVEQLTQQLGGRSVEVLHLATRHPGIPDIEILDKLLDQRTALLTQDRVLHNLAIGRGGRSFAPLPAGGLTDRKLPGVAVADKRMPVASGGLRDTYLPEADAEAQSIAGCLAGFMSEHQLKQFRTKRRRIRAHFGSLDNIAGTALTIGQFRAAGATVGGCRLKVDARHGVKALSPASETYFVDRAPHHEPLQSVVWALAQLFMLQLQCRPLTLFLCDAAALRQCAELAGGRAAGTSPVAHAASRLLGGLREVQVQPCVKGRFFDAMQGKLAQLARDDGNELVPVDMAAIAAALVELPADAGSRSASGAGNLAQEL